MFHPTLRSAFFRYAIWIWLVPLGVFLIRCGVILCHNFKLQAGFQDNGKKEQYTQRIPLEKMDFSQYNQYFGNNTALLHHNYHVFLNLPKSICYYTSPDAASPVLELPKGCMVTVLPAGEGFTSMTGYGLASYPTYQKGWRYVAPFQTGACELKSNLLDSYTLKSYYVRTEDLEAVMHEFFIQNKGMQAEAQQAGVSKQEYIRRALYKVDEVFYQNGVFISPDLYRPLFDFPNWICIIVFLFLFSIWLWRKRSKSP